MEYKERERKEIDREDYDDFETVANEFNEERRKPFPSKKKLLELTERMKFILS